MGERWLFGIEFVEAVGAEAVGETGAGMGLEELLELVPIAFVVADFFAGGANGDEAVEDLDVVEGFLEADAFAFEGEGALLDDLFEVVAVGAEFGVEVAQFGVVGAEEERKEGDEGDDGGEEEKGNENGFAEALVDEVADLADIAVGAGEIAAAAGGGFRDGDGTEVAPLVGIFDEARRGVGPCGDEFGGDVIVGVEIPAFLGLGFLFGDGGGGEEKSAVFFDEGIDPAEAVFCGEAVESAAVAEFFVQGNGRFVEGAVVEIVGEEKLEGFGGGKELGVDIVQEAGLVAAVEPDGVAGDGGNVKQNAGQKEGDGRFEFRFG